MKSLRLMHRRCPVTTPEGRLMSLFLICFALSFVFWDLFFFKETKRNKTKPKLFCRTCLLQKARKISVLAQLTKLVLHSTFPTLLQQSPNWSCPICPWEEVHLEVFRYSCDGCGAPILRDKRLFAMVTVLEKLFHRNPPCLGSAPAILMFPFELNMGN